MSRVEFWPFLYSCHRPAVGLVPGFSFGRVIFCLISFRSFFWNFFFYYFDSFFWLRPLNILQDICLMSSLIFEVHDIIYVDLITAQREPNQI